MTLLPSQASAEIHKLAHAFDILDKGIDRLWPMLPLEAMKKLSAVQELELITPTLAKRLRDIADDIEEIDAAKSEA